MTLRRRPRALAAGLLLLAAAPVGAQQADADSVGARDHYWWRFGAGAAASLLAHEGAHVATALLVGAHPTFGFDRGRPTVYSGIDSRRDPHKQFLFSSMGLDVQAALDEAVLDVPHARGSPFERGVLAGGIGTALFYVTLGRTASVSDVDYMARTSSLSKTKISLLYGGIALAHALRIAHDGRYADFFLRPEEGGGIRLGLRLD
ncbi:MAG: hypothetical protein JWN53_585 [Gemmatimonadetes bacterium]|jgi:hypothetical protein|nr:hypothetical protein [Gemmatimonadota bacterium]